MRPASLEDLEDRLSQPGPEVIAAMAEMEGDLLILGVAGKMGPSLARMARRASNESGKRRRIIGVARFTDPSLESRLQRDGIETIRCDLLDESALAGLPDVPNILYLAGMKFGATGQESLTWAMNTHLPGRVCQKFSRSRIVAFSTGNVYGLTQVSGMGSNERDLPNPVGEYAMSCLGRERIFEHFSRTKQIPMVLIRLNYATDLRYGVLVDLAQSIQTGKPVDLGMGWFNTIWQGDANAVTLRCFGHAASPPKLVNLTGPEKLRVKDTCLELGRLLGKTPVFTGTEGDTALLSDSRSCQQLFGKPTVRASELIAWTAEWVKAGGPTLKKPTHFESRDGKF